METYPIPMCIVDLHSLFFTIHSSYELRAPFWWYSPFSGTPLNLGDMPHRKQLTDIWLDRHHHMSSPGFPRAHGCSGYPHGCWCKNVDLLCCWNSVKILYLHCQDVKLCKQRLFHCFHRWTAKPFFHFFRIHFPMQFEGLKTYHIPFPLWLTNGYPYYWL